jgi:ABC-type transporter Mla MlaB component
MYKAVIDERHYKVRSRYCKQYVYIGVDRQLHDTNLNEAQTRLRGNNKHKRLHAAAVARQQAIHSVERHTVQLDNVYRRSYFDSNATSVVCELLCHCGRQLSI